jgi:hypothetical protein
MSAVSLGDVAKCGEMKCSNLDASGKINCNQITPIGTELIVNKDLHVDELLQCDTLSVDGASVRLIGIPTSSAGLPTGSVWNNAGVLNIVP